MSVKTITQSFSEIHKTLDRKKEWIEETFPDSLPEGISEAELLKLISVSEFVQDQLNRFPDWLDWMLAQEITEGWPKAPELGLCETEQEAQQALRHWRNQHQIWLIWRLVNQSLPAQQLTEIVSQLADLAIVAALDWLYPRACEQFGRPASCPFTGKPQQLYVIGMGKLGARELNLSSDVDLIFAFPTEGETREGRKNISHSEFFTKLGRGLIKLLDPKTADGLVYRVDMRLRPWGQSGPLACTFSFFERYYRDEGRDWERYAMIKARVITGASAGAERLCDIANDFVYRRYLDFHALEALRGMKQMISQEVRRQGTQGNVKLGAGGIREIEFIVQAMQMIRGGRNPELQQRNIWQLLPLISNLGLLPENVVEELQLAYEFLRDVEHVIQAWRDQQTQMLPVDELGQERLALGMGFDSKEAFLEYLSIVRETVSRHFELSIAADEESVSPSLEAFQQLWQTLDFDDAWSDELKHEISQFQGSGSVTKLQAAGRERLDALMPMLLRELTRLKDPMETWNRFQILLRNVLRRSSYLVLLKEHPKGFRELLKLMTLSPWVAEMIAEKPYLLDELTDLTALYKLPSLLELDDQLHLQLLRLPEDDLEAQMETLRHFRHGRTLRAGCCEVTQMLPLMKISDYLAHLAQVMVSQSFWLAWRHLTTKHGRPMKTKDEPCDTSFGVIAYGKAGGLELSYESDLDLVFLHEGHNQLSTEGPKPIENQVFFTRLGQKLIHLMTTSTPSGRAYEVDMRLRPSGNKGLLVSSLRAFEKYQRGEAWTWEHQALVRARFIAGDPDLKKGFEQIRSEILCSERDLNALQKDVIEMREKMRQHLGSKPKPGTEEQIFHIKQDVGGIVDIEFMVQYGVLAWAQYYPELTRWTDNIRIIQSLNKVGFFSDQQADDLLNAYLALRACTHECTLQNLPTKLNNQHKIAELSPYRQSVNQCWQQIMEKPPRQPVV